MGNSSSKTTPPSAPADNTADSAPTPEPDRHLPSDNRFTARPSLTRKAFHSGSMLYNSDFLHSPMSRATVKMATTIFVWDRKIRNACDKAIEVVKEIDMRALTTAMVEWAKKNPDKVAIIVACIIFTILCSVLAPVALGAVGFSAAGPVAGSVAAGIQASIGNVAAGSLFAVLQSAAMGGYGVAIVSGIAGVAAGGVSGLAAWATGIFKKKGGDDGEGEEENSSMRLLKRD